MGKIAVSRDILVKQGPLTSEEIEVVRKHPAIGVIILKDLGFVERELPVILHHHERFDGTGYPHGLKEREIPVGARIIAVADAFDAMTSGRATGRKMPIDSAASADRGGERVAICARRGGGVPANSRKERANFRRIENACKPDLIMYN